MREDFHDVSVEMDHGRHFIRRPHDRGHRGDGAKRKITLLSYDDGYNPTKTVEQVRKLVESDEVLLTLQILGTAPNAAGQKYLNTKKVPQLFAATGATRFTDPEHFPWTMGFNPNYQTER
jgi:branched-chain amino acid transport system substrate-binding protein